MQIYVLEHSREIDDCDDTKRIGVYASADDAEKARERSKLLPGFRDHPDGFHISEYQVGRDYWTSGFVTLSQDGSQLEQPPGSRAA